MQEGSMPVRFRGATIGLALLAGAGVAVAQVPPNSGSHPQDSITHAPPPARPLSQLQLTPDQKMTILNAVREERPKASSPVNFVASVGASVPPSIELYILPDRVLAQMPVAKAVKYTTVQNQIVLVDPTTMRVVEVIQ